MQDTHHLMTLLDRLEMTVQALGVNIHGRGHWGGGAGFGPAFRDRAMAQNSLRKIQGESGALYHGLRRATELCRELPESPGSELATTLIKALFSAALWMRHIWPVPGDSPGPRPGTHAWILQTQLGRREDPRPSQALTQRLQEVGAALDLTALTLRTAKQVLELDRDADLAANDELSKRIRAIGQHALFKRGLRQTIPRQFLGVRDGATSAMRAGEAQKEDAVSTAPRPK